MADFCNQCKVEHIYRFKDHDEAVFKFNMYAARKKCSQLSLTFDPAADEYVLRVWGLDEHA